MTIIENYNIGKTFKKIVNKTTKDIGNTVTKTIEDPVSTISKIDVVPDNVVSKIDNAVSKIDNTVSKIDNVVSKVEDVAVKTVNNTVNNVDNVVSKVEDVAVNNVDNVVSKVEDVASTGISTINKITNLIPDNIISKVGDAVVKEALDIGKTLTKGTDGIVDEIKDAVGKAVKDAIKDVTGEMSGVVKSATGEVTGIVKSTTGEVTGIVKNATSEMKNITDKIADSTQKIVKNAIDEAKGIVKDVEKTANSTIDEAQKTVKEAGKIAKEAQKEALKGIESVIDDIVKIAKKVGAFFEKFGLQLEKWFEHLIELFKKWATALEYVKDPKKAVAIVLTICVPIFGQIAARFMLFNGSMDHLWLMLFAIPPISIVPAIAMIFGYIEPLKGGIPWDNMVLIPIIGNIIGSLISSDNVVFNILKIFIGIGSFVIPYWYKGKSQCPKQNGVETSKMILDSIISYMIVLVLTTSLPYVFFIGNFFNMMTMSLPYGDLLLQSMAVFMVYVGTNIVNGSFSEICKEKIPDEVLNLFILSSISLTFIVAMAPGSTLKMSNALMKQINDLRMLVKK